MNTYKLSNCVKKELLKTFKNSEIRKQKFSYGFIHSLFNKYVISEYLSYSYCCYGEDINCWVDESVCWLKCGYKNYKPSTETLNKHFYSVLKSSLKQRKFEKSFDIFKRNLFIGENEDVICIYIPLRDIKKYDICLVFDKNKLL